MVFFQNSTAGTAGITNSSQLRFTGSSSAGDAAINTGTRLQIPARQWRSSNAGGSIT
jgi:hypothetical protein